MAFIDDIKRAYSRQSMLMRLILINVTVIVLLYVLVFGAMLFNVRGETLLQWVELPSDLSLLLRRPWTLLTYMFLHYDLLHILFNMLWFYWLGRIFMEFFSPKQLSGLYLMGGMGAALLFLLAYNLLPYFAGQHDFLVGASASVIAVVVATAVYAPDYKIGLLFFGVVSIKWVVFVTVAIYLLGMGMDDMGAKVAHIGGAIVGAWFALSIKRGHDITRPLNACIDFIVGLFNGRSYKILSFKRKAANRFQTSKDESGTNGSNRQPDEVSEQELDIILGKIKVAGYDALTDEEKDKLFKASRRRTV